MGNEPAETPLLKTPLHALHNGLDARMVPFAGYDMPVQFSGVLAEHTHTREAAGLFDVSHMGQAVLIGPDHETTAGALEKVLPSDIVGLGPGRMRYSVLLDETGGILDDLIVTRPADPDADGRLNLVVNAARKTEDYQFLRSSLPADVRLEVRDDRALLALQGPKAADIMADLMPATADMTFMTAAEGSIDRVACQVARSGYTGEDGFEISVADSDAEALAERLLADSAVLPIGLGARDTLRLEAGLCLYGHDIDTGTNPVEAGLSFTLSKRRRAAADFPGAAEILRQFTDGPHRQRVGLRLEGRAPAREGAEILDTEDSSVGSVTSGSFSPTLKAPIAMGYVTSDLAAPGTPVACSVRGKRLEATVVPMPFVPHAYRRAKSA